MWVMYTESCWCADCCMEVNYCSEYCLFMLKVDYKVMKRKLILTKVLLKWAYLLAWISSDKNRKLYVTLQQVQLQKLNARFYSQSGYIISPVAFVVCFVGGVFIGTGKCWDCEPHYLCCHCYSCLLVFSVQCLDSWWSLFLLHRNVGHTVWNQRGWLCARSVSQQWDLHWPCRGVWVPLPTRFCGSTVWGGHQRVLVKPMLITGDAGLCPACKQLCV